MSYCTYCGRELKEGETCNCRQNVQAQYPQPPKRMGNKKKLNKRTMIIGGSCGAVLIVLILVIVFLFTRGSYKKPMENVVSLINQKETSIAKYLDIMTPKFVSSAFSEMSKVAKNTEFEEYIDDAEYEIEDAFESFEYDYGDNWEIVYKITGQEKLSAKAITYLEDKYSELYYEELKYIEDDIKDMDDFDIECAADSVDMSKSDLKRFYIILLDAIRDFKSVHISEGYMLKVDFLIKGSEYQDMERNVLIPVIKVDGKWTLDMLSIMDMLNLDIYDIF